MARKASDNPWMAEELDGGDEDAIDRAYLGVREAISRELHEKQLGLVSAADTIIIGLPVPALALRYLLGSSVLPLGRIIQITGEEGSCKTSLMVEMMRWHMVYGGGAAYIENEGKDPDELRRAILCWNEHWIRRCDVANTFSLQEWMAALTVILEKLRAHQSNPDGPGRVYPYMVGIDSLMSTAPDEELAKTFDDGYASRGYGIGANLITRYMRTMPAQLRDYPFTIVGTNHLKPSVDFMGRPSAQSPGGKSVKFHETYEIEMHRAYQPDIDLLDYGGIKLKLVCKKSSVSPSRRHIFAELLWWNEQFGGRSRQQIAWDWDTASIETLLGFSQAKGKKTLGDAVMDICDITIADKTRRTAWSRALGIPQSDPQYFRVLGAELEKRLDILAGLYHVLGIIERPVFMPGVDFLAQKDAALAAARAAEPGNLYDVSRAMPVFDDGVIGPPAAELQPSAPETTDDG